MKTKKLTKVLERVEAWPPHVQNELAEFALELDAEFKGDEYEPTPEELAVSIAVCARRRKAASPPTSK